MKFIVRAHGDATVGDGDHEATVDIPYAVDDAVYADEVAAILEDAFNKAWLTDTSRVERVE
jgi:hypothetical protein